ncbi:MAG: lysophospholipid acyltransferase family protein [Pseudomonadota bacterium]
MDQWEYHPPPDLESGLSERLRNFPRQPTMLVYAIRIVTAMLLRGWMRLYHRLSIHGRNNLPDQGSFVLVCNHTSHLDTLSMLCAVPVTRVHRTFPAAATDYFFSSLPRSAISAVVINALPFDRQAKGAQSLSVCGELLKNDGNILIIFPEGTRTTTGELARFRSGIGRLVVGTDLNVVPCFLDGGIRAWPKGTAIPRPRKLKLRIGKPQNYGHLEESRDSVRQICEDLHSHVSELGSES